MINGYQARLRYFLKYHGAWYTATADAAFILGFATWPLRRWIQGSPDAAPPYMLIDSIRNSIVRAGFELRAVENPAMREASRHDDGPRGS